MYGKREISSLKEFLTVRVDRYRAPYGRRSEDYPRRCVFCGSTNEDAFLHDVTGGRRFWPVKVEQDFDIAGLVVVRDQLWAEAKERYMQGELWWLEGDDVIAAEERQEYHREADVWESVLTDRLWAIKGPLPGYGIVEEQILDGALQWLTIQQALRLVGLADQALHREQIRVALALKAVGWSRRGRRRAGNTRHSVWVPTKKFLTAK